MRLMHKGPSSPRSSRLFVLSSPASHLLSDSLSEGLKASLQLKLLWIPPKRVFLCFPDPLLESATGGVYPPRDG